MAADLTIVNLALSRFGQAKLTQTELTADVHPSAVAANTFWTSCLNEVMGETDWSFATVTLGLSSLGEDQTGEWDFIYSRPTLSVSTIFNVFNTATTDTKTEQEFEVKHIPTLGISAIYTDLDEAIAEYTFLVTNTSLWSAKFVTAFSYRLAAEMCVTVTGDAAKAINLMNVYSAFISEAKRLAQSEKKKSEEESSRYRNSR